MHAYDFKAISDLNGFFRVFTRIENTISILKPTMILYSAWSMCVFIKIRSLLLRMGESKPRKRVGKARAFPTPCINQSVRSLAGTFRERAVLHDAETLGCREHRIFANLTVVHTL